MPYISFIKKIFNIVITLVIIGGLGTPVFALEKDFYHYNFQAATDSVLDNHRNIDTLLPQSYIFGLDLKVRRTSDDNIIERATDKNIKVIPLIHQQNFDRTLMKVILLIEPIQDLLIDQLIEIADDEGFDGWQYDFENLPPDMKTEYTNFVKKSRQAFNRADLEFSLAVVPRTEPYIEGQSVVDWTPAYDIKAIAENSDYITLMAYDDPRSVGPAGSIKYAERVLDHNLKYTTADKISLGIPLYCWKWYVNDGYRRRGSLTHQMAQEDADDALVAIDGYNKTLESKYYLYLVPSGNVYMTWCDGIDGFKAKLDLIEKYNLRGFSAWAIGQEDQKIWDQL